MTASIDNRPKSNCGTITYAFGIAAFAFISLQSISFGQTWTATTAGPFNWNDSNNWSATFPNAAGTTASINANLTADQTINLGQNITVGTLNIGDIDSPNTTSNIYTISSTGGFSLTFDNNGSQAKLNNTAQAKNGTINSSLVVTSGGLLVSNLTGNGGLTLGGAITGTGNLTLAGNVSASNVNNTGSLTINADPGGSNGGTSSVGTIGSNVTDVTINRTSRAVSLSGNNSYTGSLIINSGVARISSGTAVKAANTLVLNATGSANIQLDIRTNFTAAGLSGTGDARINNGDTAAHTITLAGGGNYTSSASGFDSGTTAKLGLIVNLTGSGKQTLNGSWNFSGGVTVNSGTLAIGAADLFAGTTYGLNTLAVNGGRLSSSVTNANFGASTTGGASMQLAIHGGNVDINGASVGTFTLGNTTGGSAASNFTMDGGTIELTIASASSFDQIIGTAGAAFGITGGTLDLSGSSIAYTSTYQVFSGFGSGSASGLSIVGYDTTNFTANLSNAGLLSFTSTIPEPSTYAFLTGIAGLFSAFVVRRRR